MVCPQSYLILSFSILSTTKQNLPLGRFFVWWYAVTRTGDHRRREDKNNLKMLFLPQAAKFC